MMQKFYKVEGHSGLAKDPRTGVVINTNDTEIEGARRRKMSKKNVETEMQDLRLQVQRLTSQVEQLLEK